MSTSRSRAPRTVPPPAPPSVSRLRSWPPRDAPRGGPSRFRQAVVLRATPVQRTPRPLRAAALDRDPGARGLKRPVPRHRGRARSAGARHDASPRESCALLALRCARAPTALSAVYVPLKSCMALLSRAARSREKPALSSWAGSHRLRTPCAHRGGTLLPRALGVADQRDGASSPSRYELGGITPALPPRQGPRSHRPARPSTHHGSPDAPLPRSSCSRMPRPRGLGRRDRVEAEEYSARDNAVPTHDHRIVLWAAHDQKRYDDMRHVATPLSRSDSSHACLRRRARDLQARTARQADTLLSAASPAVPDVAGTSQPRRTSQGRSVRVAAHRIRPREPDSAFWKPPSVSPLRKRVTPRVPRPFRTPTCITRRRHAAGGRGTDLALIARATASRRDRDVRADLHRRRARDHRRFARCGGIRAPMESLPGPPSMNYSCSRANATREERREMSPFCSQPPPRCR